MIGLIKQYRFLPNLEVTNENINKSKYTKIPIKKIKKHSLIKFDKQSR